jgi:dolichyl-phosphate-mannose-protein mannosyltransferase
MVQPQFSTRQTTPPSWFWIGFICLWGIALGLRFWGLERFNTLVFDEIYFAKFGHDYLTHTNFFDAHPPLGKYLIAAGIWLKGFNTWGFRWMNALIGSCIPLIVVGLGYQLTRRYSFALIAGILAVLDGLLLVESRYGLINVYILTFGLLGHLLTLISSHAPKGWRQWVWLTLAGLSFGATAAVKWNGLGFLLGLYLFWGISRLGGLRQNHSAGSQGSPWISLSQLSFLKLFVYIPLVGAVLYSLLWIPHLLQNPEFNFVQVHQQMFSYHQRVGNGPSIHPYCSTWLSWPLMLRPVSYFYQRASSLLEPMPMMGPPLPTENARYIYSVYAMGNPFLWWCATVAIALILGSVIWQGIQWFLHSKASDPNHTPLSAEESSVSLYLATGYVANLLPWLSISRCAFLYHYMPAYLFSSLAIAWLLERWLLSPWKRFRAISLTLLLIFALSFLFWLPFYLGLPLLPTSWQLRIWYQSWI